MPNSRPPIRAFTNVCLPWTGHNYTIFPYWDDLYLVNSGFGIFTSISGTAPNRIFNIEWRAQYFPGSGSANFELRLYEGQSSRFDVIYGAVSGGANSATAGVQRDDTCFTEFFCNSPGQLTSWAAGPAGTPTPTPTVSATPTSTPHCYCYGDSYCDSRSQRNANCYCYSYHDSYRYPQPISHLFVYTNGEADTDGETAVNSPAAPVTRDDELVERVVLRKGAWPRKSTSCHHMPVAFYAAWLPRSFTLNALVNITAASPPDIRAFGDYLSSSQLLRSVFLRLHERGGRLEVAGPIHLQLIGRSRIFHNLLYFCLQA